jgi:hypothetical protein
VSRIPVLTYHAMNVTGNDYLGNDHVALAEDLVEINRRGFRVLPLHEVVQRWLRDADSFAGERIVALSCDDGSDWDYRDLVHPTAGPQRSFFNVLGDFPHAHAGAQPHQHMTAFVIASPDARRELDVACMIGQGWWNDDWWAEAVASGRMGIANHSWDHNHPSLAGECLPGIPRGRFTDVSTAEAADYEIRQAHDYIAQRAPSPSAALFAYPNGEWNEYLAHEWLPGDGRAMGIEAAFTIAPGFIAPGADRWTLPRFTCGDDWRSPEELGRILDEAARKG